MCFFVIYDEGVKVNDDDLLIDVCGVVIGVDFCEFWWI